MFNNSHIIFFWNWGLPPHQNCIFWIGVQLFCYPLHPLFLPKQRSISGKRYLGFLTDSTINAFNWINAWQLTLAIIQLANSPEHFIWVTLLVYSYRLQFYWSTVCEWGDFHLHMTSLFLVSDAWNDVNWGMATSPGLKKNHLSSLHKWGVSSGGALPYFTTQSDWGAVSPVKNKKRCDK